MLLHHILWLCLICLVPGFGKPEVPRDLEIVLARCTEDVSWLDDLGLASVTTVYTKCGLTAGPGVHLQQPNLGREGGTFLRHIIERYDSLADWTVFSQAGRPSYGYQGHRSGGGHLMNNVRFEDYVEAGKLKDQHPLFFVFSTVLIQSGAELHQCFRLGYGEDDADLAPKSSNTMCGDSTEWDVWFQLPGWFTQMISDLQQQQHAPLPGFDLPATLALFEVAPAEGVVYFAQGARFAASREAIQRRPLAYYQRLLTFMEQEDPWAGYYLEWLWWYVLGGDGAPCGDEAAVARQHQAMLTKGRLAVTEAISAVGNSTTVTGNTSFTIFENATLTPGEVVTFVAGSTTTFEAGATFSGEGTIVVAAGATIKAAASLALAVAIAFGASTLSLATSTAFSHSVGVCAFTGTVVEILTGCTMAFTGTFVDLSGATFRSASGSSISLPITVGSGTVMRLLAGTTSTFSTAVVLAGAGTFLCGAGSTLAVGAALAMSVAATFTSATLALAAGLACSGPTTAFTSAVLRFAAGVAATFSGTAVTFAGTTFSLASGCSCVFSGATVDFSGIQTIGAAAVTATQALTFASGTVLTLLAGSVTNFLSSTTLTGAGTMVCAAGSALSLAADVTLGLIATFTSATLSLAAGTSLTCSGTSVMFTSTTFDMAGSNFLILSGSSTTFSSTTVTLRGASELTFSGANVMFFGNEVFTAATASEVCTLALSTATTLTLLTSSITTFSTNLVVSGAGILTTEIDCVLTLTAQAVFEVAASFISSVINIDASTTTFSGKDVSVFSTQITGAGAMVFEYSLSATVGPVMTLTQSNIATSLTVVGKANSANRRDVTGANRRTDLTNFATVVYCGTTQTSALTLGSGTAAEFQLGCQVTGTSYSNTLSSLTAATGSIVAVTGVTTTSLPTFITTLASPADLPLEVVSSLGSVATTQTLIEYGNTGTCATAFSSTLIDNCASGYTCSITGRAIDTNTCAIELTQALASSDDDSDEGLFGLLALLILPVICCALLAFFFLKKRRVPAEPPMAYEPQMDYYGPQVEYYGQDYDLAPGYQGWGSNMAPDIGAYGPQYPTPTSPGGFK